MRRRWWLTLTLLSVSWFVFAGGATAAENLPWKTGTARVKITPDEPLWLSGYGGRDRPAEGTLHDLWVKVLALEDSGGHRAVVVTSDLLGFPKGMAERICAKLAEQCGLERADVMLTSSHSHTSPVLEDALYDIYPLDDEQKARIVAYSRALEQKIVATVAEALANLAPATLWAGEGLAEFAVNRRNNREKEVPELRERGVALAGPVDHAVPVLAVRSPEGRLRAVLFGYACHATTLSFYQWSGDYPGFAQLALEEAHPGAVAMFHAGCGADQNPIPRRTVELCEQYGRMLADAVDDVLSQPMRNVPPRLKTAFEPIDLAYEEQPGREELQAVAAKSGYQARSAARLLEKLDRGEAFPASYPYPIQVWKLGDQQLWIVLGGEVVVDYALRFKSTYGRTTWVTGYSNDVMAYIPSRRVWEEGGYESGAFAVYGRPALRWTSEIEDRIAACVARLESRLR